MDSGAGDLFDADINKDFFQAAALTNIESAHYSFRRLIEEPNYSTLCKLEKDLLKECVGKELLQFMSHLGAETISIAKMGIQVTGMEKDELIAAHACEFASRFTYAPDFILGDCLEAGSLVRKKYDYVYVGIGSIGWVPDLRALFFEAKACLKPGGKLILFEIHPIAHMHSSAEKTLDKRARNYFHFDSENPLECHTRHSWTSDRLQRGSDRFFLWKHKLDAIIQAVLDSGFLLSEFKEFDATNYRQFDDMVRGADGLWRLSGDQAFPLSFGLKAERMVV